MPLKKINLSTLTTILHSTYITLLCQVSVFTKAYLRHPVENNTSKLLRIGFNISFILHMWLHWISVAACGVQFPDQGLYPLHREHRGLATGPPGMSHSRVFHCDLETINLYRMRPLFSISFFHFFWLHGVSVAACQIQFPDQGSNQCPLLWKVDSQPLELQGSPLGLSLSITLKYNLWFWFLIEHFKSRLCFICQLKLKSCVN